MALVRRCILPLCSFPFLLISVVALRLVQHDVIPLLCFWPVNLYERRFSTILTLSRQRLSPILALQWRHFSPAIALSRGIPCSYSPSCGGISCPCSLSRGGTLSSTFCARGQPSVLGYNASRFAVATLSATPVGSMLEEPQSRQV